MSRLFKTFIHIIVVMVGASHSHHEPHIHPEPVQFQAQDPKRQRVLSSNDVAT